MSRDIEYQAAAAKAESKKAHFLANAQEARERISPSRLKNDAKQKVKQTLQSGREKAKDTVHEHPVAVGVVGVSFVALLFRRPLFRLLKRGYARLNRSNAPAETSSLKEKLHSAASAARLTGD